MPYAVEFATDVKTYLEGLRHVSRAAIETIWQDAERELGADADRLHLRNQKPPGALTFEYELPIGDGVTQYLFRFVATMEFAAVGVIRVVFAEHEVIGSIV